MIEIKIVYSKQKSADALTASFSVARSLVRAQRAYLQPHPVAQL
jgi:hypothetical protein